MIGSFIIVFREILEAALVIGVVAAAVQGLPHRGLWVSTGVGLGTLGAALIAASIGAISRFAQGNGQELFAAAVLFGAGLLLAWHNIWMAKHGRALAARMNLLGTEVRAGREPVSVLVGVTALAVMREGSEIALFLYGMAAGGAHRTSLLAGGALGLAAGIAVGAVLCMGLSRIPVSRLFRASGLIILFIAAGMIARGAQFLIQAGWLPALMSRLWDSSAVLSGDSLVGRSLGALIGYTPAPSLMQMLFWIGSFVAIGALMWSRRAGRTAAAVAAPRRRGVAARLLLMGLSVGVLLGVLSIAPVRAGDYQVYPPYVVAGENEIEARAYTGWGAGPDTGEIRAVKVAAGRGVTNWWATEGYAEAEQDFGEALKLEEFEWENRFQLTPQGRYFADVGLLNENELPRFGDDPFQIALGPDFERDFGRLSAVLDLLAVRQFGPNAASGTGAEYRAHFEYRWRRSLSPFLEVYGRAGLRSPENAGPRQQLGPGVSGQISLGPARTLNWAVAALFGTTRASPAGTLLVRAEYEFY